MTVLIDTDAFCKLALAGLLEPSVDIMGSELSDCARLPALPHMLRRGRLYKRYGSDACAALLPVANMIPALIPPGSEWLDRLTPESTIDPGEAQIFAKAAEENLMVITGDKRALKALGRISEFPEALAGKVVVLEAILISLCEAMGAEAVRQAIRPVEAFDTMIRVSFSSGNPSPSEALASYFDDLSADVQPLVLWRPKWGDSE